METYYSFPDATSLPDDSRILMRDGSTNKNITGAVLKAQVLASPVVTGQMTVPAGSASAPSMSTAGDLNTGIYFPAADTVGIVTAGAERARITSTGALLINTPTDPGYTSKLHVAGGMSFDNVANANSRVLDWYEEGTFTATATGMTTSPTGTVKYTRIGNQVTLDLPAISGTSNATTFTLTGMPTQLRPAANKVVAVRCQDNGGAFVYSYAIIGTDGIITCYKDANGAVFTATGAKTIGSQSVSYTLQ